MKSRLNERSSKVARRIATALLAGASAVAPLAYAWPFESPFVVPPASLPAPARQAGEAMLLHEAADGRTLLYVEQDQGARLAIFDVTNPAHIKSVGLVQLDVPGPFDFVASIGKTSEVVRFRQNQGEELLNLNRASIPSLETIQKFMLQGTLHNVNEIADAGQTAVVAQAALGYRSVASETEELKGLPDASQIRDRVTNSDTGTTFLLTANGVYVIRRPAAERDKEQRDWERHLMYDGG